MVESALSEEATEVTILPSPTNLSASEDGLGAIALSWVDESDNEDGFDIYRSTDGTSFTNITTVPPGTTSYTDTGLLGGEKYYYYIDSATEHTTSSSNQDSATTPLEAPSNLSVQGISTSEIEATWTDNSSNEDGFHVEYRQTGASTWNRYSSVGANTTSEIIDSLSEDVEYEIRVLSYTDHTTSSSQWATTTTTIDVKKTLTTNIGTVKTWIYTDLTSLELLDYEVDWNGDTKSWYTKWFQESKILGREDELVLRGSTDSTTSDDVAEVTVQYKDDIENDVDSESESIQIGSEEIVHEVKGVPTNETGWYRIRVTKYSGANTLYSLDLGLVN